MLLPVNGDTAVLIEDKTSSSDHSDQLRLYKKAVADGFPGHRIAAVYLKTGDQCDYRPISDRPRTHKALDDAPGQGDLFLNMPAANAGSS